jgi:hypothetical protein
MANQLPAEWCKDSVPQELLDLRQHIDQLPLPWREKMLPMCDWLAHYTRLQNRLIRVAQDAVDQLQLDVKYLLFDLEATRRERDALLKELGGADGPDGFGENEREF